MANSIIQSIKTIAKSLVDNAGYDKTRGGMVVGVNDVTNTYSVKIDGITYNNVKVVDDAKYNLGDMVKVVIPCNQATQMYISASIFSDSSLGNRIVNAMTLAGDAEQLGLDNVIEIGRVEEIAESKNKTFRQASEPTSGMDKGDIWIDTDDGNSLYIYSGSAWLFSGGGNGLNTASVFLYQRGTTAPALPSGTLTYTFADASLSPSSALNGWQQTPPPINGNPCWLIVATAISGDSTDEIAVTEWTQQPIEFIEDGATGATGLNQATIFLYSRTTSTKPSSSVTYTFANGTLSPMPTGWYRTPPTTDGNPCYVTTAVAIGYTDSVTITSGAWATPQVLVEDGADGHGIVGSLERSNYTESQWAAFGVAGYTDTWTNGDNGYFTEKIPLPVYAGDLFQVVGTATDTGNSWCVLMKCPTTTTSGQVIPSVTLSSSKSLRGAVGATGGTGATGATGPEGIVEISVESISYPNNTATLRAILFVNGVVTSPSGGYQWSYGNTPTPISGATGVTYGVSALSAGGQGLNARYNCQVTW